MRAVRQGFWRRTFLKPSYWVALASIFAYWDEKALHGDFVYDDDGSIRANPVVNGKAPWTDAFRRDFWGTPMTDIQSHKSFRPVTTLSFKLNWILFPPPTPQQKSGAGGDVILLGADRSIGTYSFHVVNVISHGIVSGLVTEAAAFVFHGGKTEDMIAQIATGFLFGLHPVHSEAVSNVTSRGEIFMSFFFLLAFLSFASQRSCLSHTHQQPARHGITSFVAIYIIPWICMTLSLFSKEQGATTLMSLVVYDFLQNHFSIVDLLRSIYQRDAKSLAFVQRTVVLAVETLVVCSWRYWLNGETNPDFIFDQNPAGFAPDRFTRAFSVTWVYCLYILDAIYPQYLTVDWSGKSIPLITDISDPRAKGVMALWFFSVLCLLSIIFGLPSRYTKMSRYHRTTTLTSFVAFLICPFLLSSNILVVVGLMKADRVIYLPLMGFCLLEAQLIRYLCSISSTSCNLRVSNWQSPPLSKLCNVALLLQILLFCRKVHERNLAWANASSLWTEAYKINPRSHHTIYNFGYNLSLQGRYKEAEQALRVIADPDVDGPTTTFVYVMVLQNLGRCEEAFPLIDRAMEVLEDQKRIGGSRYTKESIRRSKSNLLVATAFCTADMGAKSKFMLEAVETDPSNTYAIESASALGEFVQRVNDRRIRIKP